MSESLARRLSRLGSSGYIKVGGSWEDEGPWREPEAPEPQHQPDLTGKIPVTVGATQVEQ
jgi:hypothetical protein